MFHLYLCSPQLFLPGRGTLTHTHTPQFFDVVFAAKSAGFFLSLPLLLLSLFGAVCFVECCMVFIRLISLYLFPSLSLEYCICPLRAHMCVCVCVVCISIFECLFQFYKARREGANKIERYNK